MVLAGYFDRCMDIIRDNRVPGIDEHRKLVRHSMGRDEPLEQMYNHAHVFLNKVVEETTIGVNFAKKSMRFSAES